MARALDHLVLAYRDLDAAAERFRALGFLVSPRNRHPWGTHNHVVQFDGVYLELIGLGPEFKRPTESEPVFPFAGFVADFLAHDEGLAMIALKSQDAEADRLNFARAGWRDAPRFDFARSGVRDGREVKLAFSLAFLPGAPAPAFFVCQHHFPENFWDRAAQTHPNGARGIAEIRLPASPETRPLARLAQWLDALPVSERFQLPNGEIVVAGTAPATVSVHLSDGPTLAVA